MGLRSLPFFKAKKGWQFAGGGGGLSADGGGGGGSLPIATTETLGAVRVGYGLDVTNDGILSSTALPSPPNTIAKVREYNKVTISTSWTQIDTVEYGVFTPIMAFAYNYNSEHSAMSSGFDIDVLAAGGLYIRGSSSWTTGTYNKLYIYYIERSE